MPDFRAKMHQKSISVGALPQTPLGNLQRSYRLSFGGPTSKGRGGKGKGGEGRGAEGKGWERRGGEEKGRMEERERGRRLLFQTF